MPDRRKLPRADKPLAIRIPPPLLNRIKEVASRLGMSDAEVIRLAAGIGLEHLRRIDYDLPSAILDASGVPSRAAQAEDPPGEDNGGEAHAA